MVASLCESRKIDLVSAYLLLGQCDLVSSLNNRLQKVSLEKKLSEHQLPWPREQYAGRKQALFARCLGKFARRSYYWPAAVKVKLAQGVAFSRDPMQTGSALHMAGCVGWHTGRQQSTDLSHVGLWTCLCCCPFTESPRDGAKESLGWICVCIGLHSSEAGQWLSPALPLSWYWGSLVASLSFQCSSSLSLMAMLWPSFNCCD